MKYVKIASVSITTPEDLFTLGVSTSRGKADKIGQFGSGTLLGTLAWMRAYGKSPIFMVNGQKITFQTRQVLKSDGETFTQVLLCNGRKKTPINVALEYGELDWKTPCLGLREWISNALDAGALPKDLMSLTDTTEAKPDEVAIFVPYTEIAKDYFDNIGQYFLHFVGQENERIVEKKERSICRIYRKGVFIREIGELSICDYNLNFNINECRTGSSDSILSDIEYEIRFNLYEQKSESVTPKIVDAILANEDIVETKKSNWDSISVEMKEIFLALVGKIGLCPSNFIIANCTPVSVKWHTAIIKAVPEINGLNGITKAEIEGFAVTLPSEKLLATYNKYCELIEVVGLSSGLKRPKLWSYTVKPDEFGKKRAPRFCGMYDGASVEVMIWADGDSIEETIVHELAHHYSGNTSDWSSEFAKFGHDLVAAIMKQLM